MPRINPLDPDISHQNQIREWVHIGVELNKISIKDLAKKTGINPSTMVHRMQYPSTFRMKEIWAIERVIGKLEEFSRLKSEWDASMRNGGIKKKVGNGARKGFEV